VFGPFHLNGHHISPMGPTLPRGYGRAVFCLGAVKSPGQNRLLERQWTSGRRLQDGFYDVQHPEWQEISCEPCSRLMEREVFGCVPSNRAAIRANGWTSGRHAARLTQNPYRPAHLHCMIQAEAYDRLITHVFVEGDAYLDSDAVFWRAEFLYR